MIYEWRVYEAAPGKKNALKQRFANHSMKLFEEHGIRVVGFWENKIGGTSTALYYLLAFDDLSHLDAAWRGFSSDPEWQRVVAESEKDGPLVAKITNMVLTPTAFSPLK